MIVAHPAPVDPPTGTRRRRPGTVLVILCALLALAIAGHRLVPDVRGLGSMVDSAAPWFGVGIVVLLVAALIRRSPRAIAAVLLPTVAWLALFGGAWWPHGGGPVDLRVASQNLRAGNPEPGATAAALAAAGADLIGLQEVTDASRPEVAGALADRYPHQVVESTVELWSRYPIDGYTGVDIGLGWIRALRAEVATPHGTITVYVVHLASARAGNTAARDHTISVLASKISSDPAPRILVLGDLNTAGTDRALAPLTDRLRDTQQAAGSGFGFTWPAAFPVTRPDHVLYRGFAASQADVLRTPGSDHRAITAGLRF